MPNSGSELFSRYLANKAGVLYGKHIKSVLPHEIPESSQVEEQLHILIKNVSALKIESSESSYLFIEIPPGSGALITKLFGHQSQDLATLHSAFTRSFGSIVDFFGSAKNSFTANWSNVFPAENCDFSEDPMANDYSEKCAESGVDIDSEFMATKILAFEANGNLVVYKKSGLIFMYAPDRPMDTTHLIPVQNQPPDTFFRIDQIPQVDTWVNKLLDSIELSK